MAHFFRCWSLLAASVGALLLLMAPGCSLADQGDTWRVSLSSSGEQGNKDSGAAAISADGRYVRFSSRATNLVAGDTNGLLDVFVHQYLSGDIPAVCPQGWLNPGWNWFSIPLDPAGWPEASDLLGFDSADMLYRWDPLEKRVEVYPDDFLYLVRGRGYLLRLSDVASTSYDALSASGDFEKPS